MGEASEDESMSTKLCLSCYGSRKTIEGKIITYSPWPKLNFDSAMNVNSKSVV